MKEVTQVNGKGRGAPALQPNKLNRCSTAQDRQLRRGTQVGHCKETEPKREEAGALEMVQNNTFNKGAQQLGY